MIKIGTFRKQPQGFNAFIPEPFPPKGGFALPQKILQKNDEAARLLGKLDGITQLLPDVDFFLFMYIRKDAASSSQIEGTNATMIDAIEAEAKIDADMPKDVDDILHYIKALNYGMKRIKEFPFSLRFIRELHKELMEGARTTHNSYPGEFRRSQNWIGGTKPSDAMLVPPPVNEMNGSLGDIEKFIRSNGDVLPLVKAGILHAQFETIHPFTDGNGRTGRMLVTFFLWKAELLERPVLFLSSFFRKHQKIYYARLHNYHAGEVEEWLDFFLEGVIEISKEAIDTVKQITFLRERDTLKIQKLDKRASESAVKFLPKLFQMPIITVKKTQEWTGFSRAGSQKLIDRFVKMKILHPREQEKKYSQSYMYKDYIDIFNK
ncbi:MAG: Fic family protein [Patescibacteria group bacterium]|nr:Fic family protein [Patescibacteria group bacterium]